QHLVLEITASVGSHHTVLKGDNSVSHSAAGYVRYRHYHAAYHVVVDQCAPHNSRHESGIDLDPCCVISEFPGFALWIGRNRPLARADLWLGALGLRLGAAGDISLRGSAASRDWLF